MAVLSRNLGTGLKMFIGNATIQPAGTTDPSDQITVNIRMYTRPGITSTNAQIAENGTSAFFPISASSDPVFANAAPADYATYLGKPIVIDGNIQGTLLALTTSTLQA